MDRNPKIDKVRYCSIYNCERILGRRNEVGLCKIHRVFKKIGNTREKQ